MQEKIYLTVIVSGNGQFIGPTSSKERYICLLYCSLARFNSCQPESESLHVHMKCEIIFVVI